MSFWVCSRSSHYTSDRFLSFDGHDQRVPQYHSGFPLCRYRCYTSTVFCQLECKIAPKTLYTRGHCSCGSLMWQRTGNVLDKNRNRTSAHQFTLFLFSNNFLLDFLLYFISQHFMFFCFGIGVIPIPVLIPDNLGILAYIFLVVK